MRINSIDLINFRCFESFEAPATFHPQMNVIAANNGAGKSAILDAITVALSPFANSFEHGDSHNFRRYDATLIPISIPTSRTADGPITGSIQTAEAQYPIEVTTELQLNEKSVMTRRSLLSSKGRTTTKDAAQLQDYAKHIDLTLRDPKSSKNKPLPVISYYGTGRLHAQKKLTSKSESSIIHNPQSRTMGYLNCLSAESTYKHFVAWMKRVTYAKIQDSQHNYSKESSEVYADILDGVADAINTFIIGLGYRDLRYSVGHEELSVICGETRLPLASLSDGLRSIIAMVGDLAYRCVLLNPHLGGLASKETPGIVLIDEIEMHLHPSWQQKIIAQLQEAFPKIQFICTTHSPQVLSTVKPENILIIQDDGTICNGVEKGISTYGTRSNFVLEDLMGVSPDPQLPEILSLKEDLKHQLDIGELILDSRGLKNLEGLIGSKSPFIRNLKSEIIKRSKGDA